MSVPVRYMVRCERCYASLNAVECSYLGEIMMLDE